MGEADWPATWPHSVLLGPVTKGLKYIIIVGDVERSKSQTLRFTRLKAVLCVHCLCGLQMC